MMIFESIKKHSLRQLSYLQSVDWRTTENFSSLTFWAEQCVQHGLPVANEMLDRVECDFSLDDSMRRRVYSLRRQLRAIMETCNPVSFFNDTALLAGVYSPDGYTYYEAPNSRSLCVVFSTSFNNFYFSNLILLLLLRQKGVSVLILKDDSPFHCLKGVRGIAEDFGSLATYVKNLVRQKKYENLFLLGFSSGGFPALQLSALLDFTGLLVFSPRTDYSGAVSAELIPELTRMVLDGVGQESIPFLPSLLASASCQSVRRVIYGGKATFDLEHAGLLSAVPSVELVQLPGSGHNTVAHLMASGELSGWFDKLLFPLYGKAEV